MKSEFFLAYVPLQVFKIGIVQAIQEHITNLQLPFFLTFHFVFGIAD